MTHLDSQLVIEAELLSAFAETSGHLKVEEIDCLRSHYLLLVMLGEADAVGHSSCALYDLIYNIITDRAVLKTYYVDHAV